MFYSCLSFTNLAKDSSKKDLQYNPAFNLNRMSNENKHKSKNYYSSTKTSSLENSSTAVISMEFSKPSSFKPSLPDLNTYTPDLKTSDIDQGIHFFPLSRLLYIQIDS